jgi:hypothetical protein
LRERSRVLVEKSRASLERADDAIRRSTRVCEHVTAGRERWRLSQT